MEPEGTDLIAGGLDSAVVVDPHVRGGATLLVGGLPGDPVARVRLVQPALVDQPPHAGLGVGADDDAEVLVGPEPAFDEEGHVVDRDRLDVRGGPQLAHPCRDGRAGDPVEVGQGSGVREDDRGECRPVEGPVRTDELRPEPLRHGGQGRPAGFDDLAGHDVAVDDVRAELTQGGGHRGLPRPDPPGETDVEHLDRLEPRGF